MTVRKYLDEMRCVQENLLKFIEDEEDEGNFNALRQIFNDTKINENKHKLNSFLYLISKISHDHHQGPNFFDKIQQVLLLSKDSIHEHLSNFEIFNIFRDNKRILLFLIEEKMIIIDKNVAKIISKSNFEYFLPELMPFQNDKWFPNRYFKRLETKIQKNFSELRKTGENENFVSKLIRNDSVEEFITYVSERNIKLNSKIPTSVFETHFYKEDISFIEYAALYGSLKIFNYLKMNDVELLPKLWIYAIHSQNPQIIKILEEDKVQPPESYVDLFYEAAKCHHNSIADYIIEKHFNNDEKQNLPDIFRKCLEYYNFSFIQNEMINESSIFDLCKFNYYILLESLLQNKDIDVNQKEISLFPT